MRSNPVLPLTAALVALSLITSGVVRAQDARPASYNLLTPTEQYLTLRRLSPPTVGITPDAIAQNPAAYQGATLEFEGTLTGIVGNANNPQGGILLLLNADGYGSLNLTMSALPPGVTTGSRVRVLVTVPNLPEDKVTVGMPDLQVTAVAAAADIAAAVYRWRQSEAQRIARIQQREATLAARARTAVKIAPASVSRATRSSRSVTSRFNRISGQSVAEALSADAQNVFPAYRAYIARCNPRLTENQTDAITASLLLYCERYDVDPRLMVAVIIAESDFRPGITSNKGAMGIAQLMPDEAQSLGLNNPYDPVQNIAGAVYLIKRRLDKYSGGASQQDIQMQHIILALASYNAGEGAVKRYKGVPPYRETQNYVRKIEKIYRQLCQDDARRGGQG